MGRIVVTACLAICAWIAAGTAYADIKMRLVVLGPSMPAMIYAPDKPGPKTHIAVVTIHPYSSYLTHTSCTNLAERGYTVICANTPWTNSQYGYTAPEKLFPVVKAAIARVRAEPGIDRVVLLGHSAGAPLMAFYQNIAQNGPAACKGPEKLMPCEDALVGNLALADGLLLLDPHLGDGFATLTYIDPAITSDTQPAHRDASLDLYDQRNGYDPATGRASYPQPFHAAFLAAQAARNARLIEAAQAQLAAITSKSAGATGVFADDMPFVIPGGTSARLWQPDISLLQHTQGAYRLLKADGSTPTQVLRSVRQPSGNRREALGYGSVLQVSVRGFLAAHAIRTTADYDQTADDVTGVDWASSNTSTIANIKGVTVPLLIEVMTGHYFLRPGEMILQAASSPSKEMVGVEGASHGITPCAACGSSPIEFGDTVKRAYDYADMWLATHF